MMHNKIYEMENNESGRSSLEFLNIIDIGIVATSYHNW